IGTVPRATAGDLDRALAAAQTGWRTWRDVDATTRSRVLAAAGRILEQRSEELVRVLTAEQGKPLAESRNEVGGAIDQFDWFAGEARRIYGRVVPASDPSKRLTVLREPIGPVAAFTPWNFPALLPARKIAPALAAGCSMIIKPAEEAPGTALMIARALQDAGLPDGVLNVVTGDPAAVSAHLLASPIIRKVSLTGSSAVGRLLIRASAEQVQDISLELGGHAPVLVFPDIDPTETGTACARAKFRNAGQVCIAGTRFYVHDSIVQEFSDAFVRETRALKLGAGTDEATDIGPLSSARRRSAVEEHVADALDRGASLLTGGRRPEGFARGYFYEPTVLAEVPAEADIMQIEPFGPVAPISSFQDFDQVISLANSTPFGLAGYVFTRDLRTATLATEGLEVGMVAVNHFSPSSTQIPFGGVKRSGIGAENGSEAIDAYTVVKTVSVSLV
ncbi:MAG: NAD-dependent succinate-semialdehyde dehydrogenase, partial [Euzebya sp.]